MNQESKTTTKTTETSNAFLDYFGFDIIRKHYKKISEYTQKHFEKYSALLVATTTLGIWIIRAFGYAYQSGKLSVYNIDKSYIALDDNFFLQIIEFIAVGIFFIAVNYVYFCVATKKDSSKFQLKRKCRKAILYMVEILIILAFIILQKNYSFDSFFKELRDYSFSTWIALIIMLLVLVCSINIFGIQIVHSKYKKTKNDIVNPSDKPTEANTQLRFIITMLVFLSILTMISYIGGVFEERQRTNYKIIAEQTEESMINSAVFTFHDNVNSFLYVIVYENKDVYILCQLEKSENKIIIDTNYQKIVSKDNLETYSVNNIYKISLPFGVGDS